MSRNVAILGAGNISVQYLAGLSKYSDLVVTRIGDIDPERSKALALKHNVPNYGTAEEVYGDPGVDIIVSLTPPALHASTVIAALQSGKSVFVEKPLATSRQDGLLMLAAERSSKGRIGSAPDTFLGSAGQTARQAVDSGLIGDPIGATAFVRSSRAETWHPDPTFLFSPGGGPVMDMGPYYIAALANLLGPVSRVVGAGRIGRQRIEVTSENRTVEHVDVTTNTHTGAVLTFASGALATTMMSFDVWDTSLPRIEVYGTLGTLSLHDPNQFDGDVKIKQHGDLDWRVLEPVAPLFGSVGTAEQRRRGLGVQDLAQALDGAPHRTNSEFAFHVLDVLLAIEESAGHGDAVTITSTAARPEPTFTTQS